MQKRAAGALLLIHTVLTWLIQLTALMSPQLASWLAVPSLLGTVTRAVVMQGALILLPTLWVIWYFKLTPGQITGHRSTPSSLILAVVVGIPAGVVFQGLNNLTLYFAARMGIAIPQSTRTVSDQLSQGLWDQGYLIILTVVIIQVLTPAVVEELMFRGVIQGSLKRYMAPFAALIWQAVAFSLFHSNPVFIVAPLLAGLLLGLLRQNGNSILPGILAHLSMNLTLLLISPLLPELTAHYLNLSTRSTSSLFYASLIATFIAAVALVPLLALISHLRPENSDEHVLSHQINIYRLGHGDITDADSDDEPEPGTSFIPRDWKFALALLMLLATMMVTYFQAI
ncbi:MAG: type II CAAX endopeptidase family protein [Eubacteriales bacterium]|nr:type II CAAX endopeptidase family protein [Eubacteriales bacterium]